jgi:3',5'-cyclic AMP phosphodiesterase CpdA
MCNFIFATDLHFESGTNPKVQEASARVNCLINDINRHNPDFVLFGGDISQYGTIRIDDLIVVKQELNKLTMPYFTVAGNHDLAPSRRISEIYPDEEQYHNGSIDSSNFFKVFGNNGMQFSFIKNNIQFIGISLRDREAENTLDWLEHETQSRDMPKIVMTHYGLYPPRDSGSPLETWGFGRIKRFIPRLRSIIENPDNRVIAYLYGHNHINSVVKKKNILHISGGGIQKGCTGYWLFECKHNHLNGRFNLLSDKNLHNFNYHGITSPEKCVDSSHKTVKEYHKGNRQEQSIYITLIK